MSEPTVTRPSTPVAEGSRPTAPAPSRLGQFFDVFSTIVNKLDHLLDEHNKDSCMECMNRAFEAQAIDDRVGLAAVSASAAACMEGDCPWSFISTLARTFQLTIPVMFPDFSAGCILPSGLTIPAVDTGVDAEIGAVTDSSRRADTAPPLLPPSITVTDCLQPGANGVCANAAPPPSPPAAARSETGVADDGAGTITPTAPSSPPAAAVPDLGMADVLANTTVLPPSALPAAACLAAGGDVCAGATPSLPSFPLAAARLKADVDDVFAYAAPASAPSCPLAATRLEAEEADVFMHASSPSPPPSPPATARPNAGAADARAGVVAPRPRTAVFSPAVSATSAVDNVTMYPLLGPGVPTPILPPPPPTHFGAGLVARRALARSSRFD